MPSSDSSVIPSDDPMYEVPLSRLREMTNRIDDLRAAVESVYELAARPGPLDPRVERIWVIAHTVKFGGTP